MLENMLLTFIVSLDIISTICCCFKKKKKKKQTPVYL